MAQKKHINYARVMFYLAGLILVIKFLMEGGVPSPSSDILKFIVGLFTLIVVVGFYCFFLFGAKGCTGTIRALAPCVLLLVLYGRYSITFGNANVDKYLIGIADMAWTLLIICGFVNLFVKQKILTYVFSYSSLVYAAFVFVSYIVMLIITLVNGGNFSLNNMIITVMLVCSLVLVGFGSLRVAKRQEW